MSILSGEWDGYFDLRWRILRRPWDQQPGSERDVLDQSAFHFLTAGRDGRALACGHLHRNSPAEAQTPLRMSGDALLAALEAEAGN